MGEFYNFIDTYKGLFICILAIFVFFAIAIKVANYQIKKEKKGWVKK